MRLAYVGTRRGLEARVMPHHPAGVAFYTVPASPIPRRFAPETLRALGVNALGLLEALRVLYEFRPHLVIGTGGYASFGVLAAALMCRIPTVIHEQNALPGLVNRSLAPWVGRAWCAYPETLRALRTPPDRGRVTGIPLRASVLAARALSRDEAKRALRLDPQRPLIVALGGSHGARALHDALLFNRSRRDALTKRDAQLAIVAGRDAPRLVGFLGARSAHPRGGIRVLSHTPQIGLWMRAADVVVTRAGGTTLAELLALGAAMIVVPWPGAAEGHQEANARLLAREGACRWLPEDELKERLLPEVLELLERPEERRQLVENAARYGELHARARDFMLKEVERDLAQPSTRPTKLSRRRLSLRVRALVDALALHRDRRGRDERLGSGSPRAGALRPRFGP